MNKLKRIFGSILFFILYFFGSLTCFGVITDLIPSLTMAGSIIWGIGVILVAYSCYRVIRYGEDARLKPRKLKLKRKEEEAIMI
mgnify:CR=1 FL=1